MPETQTEAPEEYQQPLAISLTTELTAEQVGDSSGYIQFLSKHDENGLTVYFFNDKSHIEAIRHNKAMLGLADATDLEASGVFYKYDYAAGITGGQIYRDRDGKIENIFFSSNCEAITYKELRAIVMQLLDHLPDSMKSARMPVRLLMTENSPYYHRRYLLVKSSSNQIYSLRPTMPTARRNGEDVPLQWVLDANKQAEEEK